MENVEQKPIIKSYTYEEAPTLWRFSQCNKRIKGVRGARGSGKSSACIVELITRGLEQIPNPTDGIRRTRYVIIRNTFRQLNDTTVRKTFEWFPPELFGEFKKTEMNYIINRFKDVEIELSFRALDRPEHVRNLLSLELTGAFINEAREVPKAVFDGIDACIGRYPSIKDGGCTYPFIIMDTNSPEEDSWWYKYFEEMKPDNAEQFVQPSGRSPYAENLKFLPPDYYEEMIKGKDEDYIKVYVDNEYGFVREGDLIYEKTWVDSLHVAKNMLYPIKGRLIVASFDFGLTPAAVFMQITPDGHLNIIEEYVSESMGIRRFINNIIRPLIATKYYGHQIHITGDPTGTSRVATDEKTCYEEIQEALPNILISPASTNSPIARIGAVEYFLTQRCDYMIPSLQLSPECRVLRKGFNKGYVKDKLGNPKKNNLSHIHDALGYGALYFKEMIKREEKVKTYTKKSKYHSPTVAGL